MTTTRDSAFTEYLEALSALVELPHHRDAALAQAQQVGRAEVDSAMAELRDLRTTLAACEDDVVRLTSRLARLGTRTRMELDDDAPPEAPVGSVAEAGRLVEALRADISSVEGSWSWVERALHQLEQHESSSSQAPPGSARAGDDAPAPAAGIATRDARAGARVWVALAAVALVLAVVVILLVL